MKCEVRVNLDWGLFVQRHSNLMANLIGFVYAIDVIGESVKTIVDASQTASSITWI
jgi:hypothetical protein